MLSYLFSNIINNSIIKKDFIKQPKTVKNLEILKIFSRLGLIKNFEINNNQIVIYFKYYNNQAIIKNIKQISKPSKRCYITFNELDKKITETNIFIISTNKGLLTYQEAKHRKLGGEIICEIEI